MNFSIVKINNPDFDMDNCGVYHYRNDDDFKINVFFLQAKKDIINSIWKRFSNMIADNYQNSDYMSDKEFDRWNFYIIYISNDEISKELKNQIENDKFSSRKIVEDSYDKEFNDVEANRLIIKHITNTDLKEILLKTNDKIHEEYKPINNNVWKLIPDEMLLSRDKETQRLIVQQIIQIRDEN